MVPDPSTLTVDGIRAGLADGSLTAEALVQACLDRITACNPDLNAIIFLNDNALDEARAIDASRAAGDPLGPLAGVPFVAKDTMNVRGIPTTGGWHVLSSRAGGVDLIPDRDCCVVKRMRAAGAILIGKTNVPVLSGTGTHADDSWAGPTLNAVDRTLVPGGSSAGSACAVASGMVVLALAEETGGSIQNPASAHGLVGIKPTFGLVSNAGVMPIGSSTLDVMGPIARNVRDAARMLDVLAGYSPDDPKTIAGIGSRPEGGYAAGLETASFAGKRLGIFGPGWRKKTAGSRGDPLAPSVDAVYRKALALIASAGAVLVDDPFAGSGFADLAVIAEGGDEYDIRGMESVAYDVGRYLADLGPGAAIRCYSDLVRAAADDDPFAPEGALGYLAGFAEFEACRANPTVPPPLDTFFAAREAYIRTFDAVMDRHGLNALVFPQMADPVPKRGAGVGIRETTVCEINIAGLPVVTVPSGRLTSGEPFNLVFVGRSWSEASLIELAQAYENQMV